MSESLVTQILGARDLFVPCNPESLLHGTGHLRSALYGGNRSRVGKPVRHRNAPPFIGDPAPTQLTVNEDVMSIKSLRLSWGQRVFHAVGPCMP